MRKQYLTDLLSTFRAQTTSVVRDGLAFANGVVISHGGDFLLVVELMRGLVMKYGLTGPNAGQWFYHSHLNHVAMMSHRRLVCFLCPPISSRQYPKVT